MKEIMQAIGVAATILALGSLALFVFANLFASYCEEKFNQNLEQDEEQERPNDRHL